MEISKPLTDERSYRIINLVNGFEVLLICDKNTEKAAASIDVHVGSFADPEEIPGLAHFLEHLLFMGTEKFPGESEYLQFLVEHAGGGNAFTSAEHTNYHFEIAYDAIWGALDRFSQFFISPLFSESCKDREIMAVDSENKKNLQMDAWRLNQLEKSLSNPEHPIHKFSTGNQETLGTLPESEGIDVRDRLIKFYKERYSANIMKLVVLARDSLDELEAGIRKLFSPVINSNLPLPKYESKPLTPAELGIVIEAQTVMDAKHLEITFPVPDQQPLYESQPYHYYAHLIGHESEGGLLHFLKMRKWASELSCGITHICRECDYFLIDIALTNEGLQEWRSVLGYVFVYIEMTIKEGPQQWIFDEISNISRARFLYKQKTKPAPTVTSLAQTLHRPIPRSRILDYTVTTRYDPEAISRFGDLLTPENMRVLVASQDLEGLDQKEKWYGTKYRVTPLGSVSTPSDVTFHLPLKNEFLPSKLHVQPKAPTPHLCPTLLVNEPDFRLWHKQDDSFAQPKSQVNIKFSNPLVSSDVFQFMSAVLFVALIEDALVDFAYYADTAGLKYVLFAVQGGIEVEVYGFDEKLDRLVAKVIQSISNCELQKDRFSPVKEHQLRLLHNTLFTQPFMQRALHNSWFLSEKVYHIDAKLEALEKIEFDDVLKFATEFRRGVSAEMLFVGSLSSSAVTEIGRAVRASLPSLTFQPKPRSYIYPIGEHYWCYTLKDEGNGNNAIEYGIELGTADDINLVTTAVLLEQIMKEPVFDQLRTKEQLGYVVGCSLRQVRNSYWVRFFAQSEEVTTYLESRINACLLNIREIIMNMEHEEYQKNVDSVVAKYSERPKNLAEEASRYWSTISQGFYDFELRNKISQNVQSVRKGEVLEFFDKFVSPLSAERRVFVLHLEAKQKKIIQPEVLLARQVGRLASERDLRVNQSQIMALSSECRGLSQEQALERLKQKLVETGYKVEEAQSFVDEVVSRMHQNVEQLPFSGSCVNNPPEFLSHLDRAPAAVSVKDLSTFQRQDIKL